MNSATLAMAVHVVFRHDTSLYKSFSFEERGRCDTCTHKNFVGKFNVSRPSHRHPRASLDKVAHRVDREAPRQ